MSNDSRYLRTAKNNLSYISTIPLLSSDSTTPDYQKIFNTLKTLLLDGSFELSLLHIQHLSDKLKSTTSSTSPSPLLTSESSSQDDITVTSQVNSLDTQELNLELTSAMDTQESDITASSDEGSKSLMRSPKKLKSSAKSSEDGEFETVVKVLCDHEDPVKALSEFYTKFVENGPEREKERDELKRASPVFKLYNEKALNDQDRYLDTLGGLLRQVLIYCCRVG